MTDYIEGGVMGHSNEELKRLHDFTDKYKKEQDQKKEQVISAYESHLSNIESIFRSNEDNYRNVLKISEGKFLIIQKMDTRLTMCISTDDSISLAGHNYKDDIKKIERLEIIDFNTTSKKMEAIYVWDQEALIRQLNDNIFYGNATLKIEVQELAKMTKDEKVQKLEKVNILISSKQLREENS